MCLHGSFICLYRTESQAHPFSMVSENHISLFTLDPFLSVKPPSLGAVRRRLSWPRCPRTSWRYTSLCLVFFFFLNHICKKHSWPWTVMLTACVFTTHLCPGEGHAPSAIAFALTICRFLLLWDEIIRKKRGIKEMKRKGRGGRRGGGGDRRKQWGGLTYLPWRSGLPFLHLFKFIFALWQFCLCIQCI